MLNAVSVNGCYRYSKVSFLANQSGTADNFVSIFIREEVFLFRKLKDDESQLANIFASSTKYLVFM